MFRSAWFKKAGWNFSLIQISLFLLSISAHADCAPHEPWGKPGVTDGHEIVEVCHKGYAAGLDRAFRGPRWVDYELTGDHSLGCYSRNGLSFKVDDLAPSDYQGQPRDYSRSGYDLGHMAPNQDFAWDKEEQRDTFSFANVAPQLPGLNRQGWERLEEDVRAWALSYGKVEVYVGPIYGASRKSIGADKIPIPTAFFKVIVDKQTGRGLGFIMPQKTVPKGKAERWRVAISEIERQANVRLPLPVNWSEEPKAWPSDRQGWRKMHRSKCQ